MRYLAGFIIGALLVAAFQYNARTKDIVKSEKQLLSSVSRSHYTGCLVGKKTKKVATTQTKVFCKAKTENYMKFFQKLYGGSDAR